MYVGAAALQHNADAASPLVTFSVKRDCPVKPFHHVAGGVAAIILWIVSDRHRSQCLSFSPRCACRLYMHRQKVASRTKRTPIAHVPRRRCLGCSMAQRHQLLSIVGTMCLINVFMAIFFKRSNALPGRRHRTCLAHMRHCAAR